jgi:type II secretory pathway pseudopilin PulG
MLNRAAITLIEVLIAIAILSLLIALILPAIQKARESALRSQSVNNLRQIALGTHQIAAVLGDFVGGYPSPADPKTIQEQARLFDATPLWGSPLTYSFRIITGQPVIPPPNVRPISDGLQPVLISPADPSPELRFPIETLKAIHYPGAPTSYAYNMVGFLGPIKFPGGIKDGTSNTIAYCERYHSRYGSSQEGSTTNTTTGLPEKTAPSSLLSMSECTAKCDASVYGNRRASFADAGWGDVVPVTDPQTRLTQPSRSGVTFQVRPLSAPSDLPGSADVFLPQTPFSAGLPTALFDGSVRIIRPSITPEAFWATVTPTGAETNGID